MAGIVFLALCIAFAITCWSSRPAAPRAGLEAIVLLRSLLPPILLGWCLFLGSHSPLVGSLRLQPVALEAVADTPGQELFRAGSGPRQAPETEPDLMISPGLRAAQGEDYADLAVVRVAERGKTGLTIDLTSRAVPGGAIVAVAKSGSRPPAYVGSVDLRANDEICLGRCFVFDGKGSFVGGGEPYPLPVRTGLPGLIAPWPADTAVYPLRATGLPGAAAGVSFLFQQFPDSRIGLRTGGTWHLVVLDPGLSVQRGGKPHEPECGDRSNRCTQSLPLASGSSINIRLARINYGSGEGAACESSSPGLDDFGWWRGENPNPACRLIDRRSFSVTSNAATSKQAPVAVLHLGGQEVVALGTPAQTRARLARERTAGDPDSFVLKSVSGGGREGSPLASAIDNFRPALRSFLGGTAPNTPDAIPACRADSGNNLCAGDARQGIRFELDETQLPWLLLIVAIGSAIAVHALSARRWQDDRVEGLVIAAIQFLLALRAVIAAEGAMIDPEIDWRDLFGECAMAMAALPTVILMLRPRGETHHFTLAALAVFNLLVFAAIRLWLGEVGKLPTILLGLALAAIAVRWAISRPWPWRGPAWMAGPRQRLTRSPEWLVRHAALLIVMLAAGRLLLPLLGFKERIGVVAVSTLYLPPLLFGFAALLAAAAADPAGRQRRAIQYCLVALLAMGVPLLARDNGFGFVYIWPLLGIAAWQATVWRRAEGIARGHWAWIAPAPALALFSYATLLLLAATLWHPPGKDSSLEAKLDYSARLSDSNSVRLLAAVAPDSIAQIGTLAASQQMTQTIHLVERGRKLVASDYMEPSNLPIRQEPNLSALRDVHLTDNVAAVHLMGPFGRVAAFGLLLVLFTIAAALCAGASASFWARWHPITGALAIWTIFGAATYMVLANLLIVPFTGRNIYLLAPSSGADLIEGLALFAIALAGLRSGERA